MKNCEKSQIFMLSLIVILLVVTPLLSSSVRTTYLYFITNLLIIALGAQAGVLRAFSKPVDHEKKKPVVSVPQKPVVSVPQKPVVSVLQKPMLVVPTEVVVSAENTQIKVTPRNDEDQRVSSERPEKINGLKMSSKSKSQKITGTVKTESRVRKCPSMPSLFFIGGGETETEGAYDSTDDDDVVLEDFHQIEEEDEVVADLSGQELLIKAENFIGNFYKQLKMQREESWKRIHGIYHKAF